MKRIVICLLLPWIFGACSPFPKDDDDSAANSKPGTAKATATPKPTPGPGAWMYDDKKRDNPLEKKAFK